MALSPDFGVKFVNFKCFGAEGQGFDCIKLVNVIIGRNNSGKSALLDGLKYLTLNKFDEVPLALRHANQIPEFVAQDRLRVKDIEAKVTSKESTSDMPGGGSHQDVVLRYQGALVARHLRPDKRESFVSIESVNGMMAPEKIRDVEKRNRLQRLLISPFENPLKDKIYRRLFAERRVTPETESDKLVPSEDGGGATNMICRILDLAKFPRAWVEKDLLQALNKIMNPDLSFKRIFAERLEGGAWEVFLEDEYKEAVGLSESGSGIKTVILVLLNLLLVPKVHERPTSQFVFAFEELENNLHPSLLRRLLLYILDFVRAEDVPVFLTTHSSVAIDVLSRENDCQMIHVVHDGTRAEYAQVKTLAGGRAVLDDLDVRASDLLQSNGVIWVEGPSDATYINRWIEIFSDGKLKPGLHYQFVHYGGSLLSHLTAQEKVEADAAVDVLILNRNCCVVIDSDKKAASEQIRQTKQRVADEVRKANGVVWITAGKEIENYVHVDAISQVVGKAIDPLGQYAVINTHLEAFDQKWANGFSKKKTHFASEAVRHFGPESLDVLDLRERISELCAAIRKWNRSADPIAT